MLPTEPPEPNLLLPHPMRPALLRLCPEPPLLPVCPTASLSIRNFPVFLVFPRCPELPAPVFLGYLVTQSCRTYLLLTDSPLPKLNLTRRPSRWAKALLPRRR